MAVYAALFLLVAGVAGVLTVTAESPEVAFENPDHELSSGDTFEVDGTEYVVAEISEVEEGGGGHGGSAETSVVATIEQGNETIEVEDESTVTLGETDFVANFPDGTSTLTLSSDMDEYEAQVAGINQFEQYNSGLTRVLILSLFSVVLLLAAAFVPSRY
ncbi:hypothetical protein [Halorubrum sp. CSM-61]|uniref:hypothetical protein n=1 Tax=Halorubrum sp. CSM-61 TaxID=2485838 RepID=UPI000F4BC630|nr:hypothetical protein [Halorubrum sp. CSM-61]